MIVLKSLQYYIRFHILLSYMMDTLKISQSFGIKFTSGNNFIYKM